MRPERPSDAPIVNALQQVAFGPGAYARAAFRVREQAPHDPSLSFVTELNGALVASVRMTPIRIGEDRGLLLGPLVVEPARKGQGHGKALMRHAMEEARRAGCPFVLLVGDPSRPIACRCPARSILRGCSSPSLSRARLAACGDW
jgi:predicted N-acetyltransferase YhbS